MLLSCEEKNVWVVFVLVKVSLKQKKSHSRYLNLLLKFINYANEGLHEYLSPSDWRL